MFKDLAMRVFLIHLAAFVVVTAGLAAINLWFAPQYPWFIWVLIGWGAAVATHALALLLRKTRRRERIFVDRKARSFTVHLFACGDGVDPFLRQSHRDAENVVVLLGGSRLGRRHHRPWLVRLLQAAARIASGISGHASGDEVSAGVKAPAPPAQQEA